MKNILFLAPASISLLLLGAHFLRSGEWGLAVFWAACAALPWMGRGWSIRAAQGLLALGFFLWLRVGQEMVQLRMGVEEPWARAAVILGTVAALTCLSVALLEKAGQEQGTREQEKKIEKNAPAAAFLLTLLALAAAKTLAPGPAILLADRFLPGAGWVEIFLLALYAALVTRAMLDPARSARWRLRIWLLFSLVFFSQLALGLLLDQRFLMNGDLHLPVPALIVAGPMYRGSGLFMPGLFLAAVLLAGSAWCSHLCYLGGWDGLAARGKPRPGAVPLFLLKLRLPLLVLTPLAALGLRLADVGPVPAATLAAAFGLVGVAVMIFVSRREGVMAHCTTWCPIGLLANVAGKISPWRVSLREGCTECGLCSRACRYNALAPERIRKRRPALTCTLCGDCVAACPSGQIGYNFPRLSPEAARGAFLALTLCLHAVFLGTARL